MVLGTYRFVMFILLLVGASLGKTLPDSMSMNNFINSEGKFLNPVHDEDRQNRVKRSPFIMAFQVTKPPGMFSMSLRRPYFLNMISNMTRSLFSSNFSEMIRRGFRGLPTNSTDGDQIRSRQEDLEIFYK